MSKMSNGKCLIDAKGKVNGKGMFNHTVTKVSKDAPIVDDVLDVVAVVHAEWLDIKFDPTWRSMLATCSHCKVRGEVRAKSNECGFAVPDSDYCPHCGAKMDGGINK